MTTTEADYYTCDPDGEGYAGITVAEAIEAWENAFGEFGSWDEVLVFAFSGDPDGEHAELGHYSGARMKYTEGKL